MLPLPILDAITTFAKFLLPPWERYHRTKTIQAELAAAIQECKLERDLISAEIVRDRLSSMANWYPLGYPGRIRELTAHVNTILPRVLVSPSLGGAQGESLANATEREIRSFDLHDRMFHMVSGSAVADRKNVSGAQALEIARLEFDPSPSVVLTGEDTGRHGRAIIASSSCLFRTTAGHAQVDLPLARTNGTNVEVAWIAGGMGGVPEQRWSAIPPEPGSLEDRLATAVAAMTLGILTIYWASIGVQWQVAKGSRKPYQEVLSAGGAAVDGFSPVERAIREMNMLAAEGVQVTPLPIDMEGLAFLVSGDPNVVFEIGPNYPRTAPNVWIEGPSEFTRIAISANGWTPSNTLRELLDGIYEQRR